MNALVPYIIALRQQDLLEEAALRRRVKLSKGSQPNVPAWRRRLGSGAHGLSGLLASAARSLDPNVGTERGSPRESGVGRALAG